MWSMANIFCKAKPAPRNDNKQPIDVQFASYNFSSFRPLSDLM